MCQGTQAEREEEGRERREEWAKQERKDAINRKGEERRWHLKRRERGRIAAGGQV